MEKEFTKGIEHTAGHLILRAVQSGGTSNFHSTGVGVPFHPQGLFQCFHSMPAAFNCAHALAIEMAVAEFG
jgi:hypothetical protein